MNKTVLNHIIERINDLPEFTQSPSLTIIFRKIIQLAGNCSLVIEKIDGREAVFTLKKKKRTHEFASVRAINIALVSEHIAGALVGMHIKDECALILKSINVECMKKASGDIRATITLSPYQMGSLTADSGTTTVDVVVSDGTGRSPVDCELVFEWYKKEPE